MSDLVMRAAELIAVVVKERVDAEESWRFTICRRERDAARAELAGVAAQRDAHLSRSVELAARVTEFEARLAALTPATVEVDGFRVGDLVRFNGDVLPLLNVFFDETVGYSFGTVECDSPYRRKSCSQLRHMVRKPVEVGDTVRGIHSTFVDVVIGTSDYGNRCHFKVAPFRETQYLVAIAAKVAP